MASKTYKTFGTALADPTSAIARFVASSETAMSHNPRSAEEWTEYLAWQREQSRSGSDDFTTQAWRESR